MTHRKRLWETRDGAHLRYQLRKMGLGMGFPTEAVLALTNKQQTALLDEAARQNKNLADVLVDFWAAHH
jgi:hypothetical protein